MATYAEYGNKQYNVRAQTGARPGTAYTWSATGSRGSIPRPKPLTSLIENVTGHSVFRNTTSAHELTVVRPGDPTWTGDYQIQMESSMVVGTQSSGVVLDQASINALIQAVDAKIRLRIKDSTWNAATAVAELPSTMRFLAQSVREMWDYYRLARKGDFLRLSELYRQRNQRGERYKPLPVRVANRYLAFRMAVRPLVSDIDGAVKHLYASEPVSLIRSVSARDTIGGRLVEESLWQGNPVYPRIIVRQDNYEVRRKVYIRVDPSVAAYKQLGFTNLAAVLWELTPYSFLVDRVLPLGNLIRGLDAYAGVGRISDYRVHKRDNEGTTAVRDCFVKTKGESYSRQANLGLPGAIASMGGYQPSISASGLGDALAILVQLRNKRPVNGF